MKLRVAIGVVAALALHAQQFEAAAVKRHTGPVSPATHTVDPGRISYMNLPLLPSLREAYGGIPVYGPDWLPSERYDITATFAAGASTEQIALMLRNLLVERFHLTVHNETRQFPAYDLVIAKNGPKIKEWTESASTPALPAAQPGESFSLPLDRDGFPQLPAGHSGMAFRFNGTTGQPRLVAVQQTMAPFVAWLQGRAGGAPVTDKTGLTGKYNFTLDMQREVDGAPPDLSGVLQQQLGLRLEATKIPLEVLVIDHIDKDPAAN